MRPKPIPFAKGKAQAAILWPRENGMADSLFID